MQLTYFILLWLYMGELARVKMDADTNWTLILLYWFGPFIHLSIFFQYGARGYFNKDWTKY